MILSIIVTISASFLAIPVVIYMGVHIFDFRWIPNPVNAGAIALMVFPVAFVWGILWPLPFGGGDLERVLYAISFYLGLGCVLSVMAQPLIKWTEEQRLDELAPGLFLYRGRYFWCWVMTLLLPLLMVLSALSLTALVGAEVWAVTSSRGLVYCAVLIVTPLALFEVPRHLHGWRTKGGRSTGTAASLTRAASSPDTAASRESL